MPVDASIPLMGGQFQGPDIGKVLSLADMAVAFQQKQKQQRAQNVIAQIYQNPANLDASGNLKPEALSQVMSADPATGMQIQGQTLENQARAGQVAVQTGQLDEQKRKKALDSADFLQENLYAPAFEAYDDAIDKGMNDEAANAAAQKVYSESMDSIRSSGQASNFFSPADFDKMSPKFDRPTMLGHVQQLEQIRAQQREKEKADTLAATKEAEAERKDDALIAAAQDKGAQVMLDPTNNKPYVFNPMTKKAETFDGKPYEPGGAAKLPSGSETTLSDDAADLVADQVLAGNRTALSGLARNAASVAKVNDRIAAKAKEQGLSGAGLAAKQAEFTGAVSGQRTLGTRAANMEVAANEVKYMGPLALAASEKVTRTQYPSLNGVLIAAEKGTGGEDVVRFGLATNALIYSYAKFLNPTGIPTDADKARATDILSTAWSKGQFSTAINQIQKEIATGRASIADTKSEVSSSVTGRTAPAAKGASVDDLLDKYK